MQLRAGQQRRAYKRKKPAAAEAGAGGRGGTLTLLGDAVNPGAVVALGGTHREPHLFPQGAADEAADAVFFIPTSA